MRLGVKKFMLAKRGRGRNRIDPNTSQTTGGDYNSKGGGVAQKTFRWVQRKPTLEWFASTDSRMVVVDLFNKS